MNRYVIMKNNVLSIIVVAVLTAMTNSHIVAQPEVWYPNPAYMHWETPTERVAYSSLYILRTGTPTYNIGLDYCYFHNNWDICSVCSFATATEQPQTIYGVALNISDIDIFYPSVPFDGSINLDIVLYQFTPGDSNVQLLKKQHFVKEKGQQPDLYMIYYDEDYLLGGTPRDSVVKYPIYEFYFDTPIDVEGYFYAGIYSIDTFAISLGYRVHYYPRCHNGHFGNVDMKNNTLIYYHTRSISTCCDLWVEQPGRESSALPAPLADTVFTNVLQLVFPITRPKGYLTATKPTEDVGSVRLLPNPARTRVTVEAADAIKDVQVSDMAGRVLISKRFHGDERAVTLDVASLPKGSYVVRVKTEQEESTQKLVVD